MKPLTCLVAAFAVWASPVRADVLDGIIFGVKCIGADDRQACEDRSKREADETRARMRQRSGATGVHAQGSPDAGGDTLGMEIYRNWRENVVCQAFAKRTSRDVDTTYASAMGRYSFVTPNQAKGLSGTGEWGLHIAGYLHETIPGALYRLEQVVHSPDVADGQRLYKLILEFARDGSGTRVSGQYCVTTDDPAGWQDLPARVLASLDTTF
ncbi:hypothetical protein [Aromatoleum bremense]|uniref:Uncharacterized protein n=1 Tax=Aromatoleum bremense TaxID=76115 RepID=A0ABX1NWU1_9RHOO|nr:hypothetical protein [Aromatoleum bremense]NMG16248.1 hypothetical protein [Aromatoleum bremense]QTQ30107.1 Uncharacterized protein pbN1_01140 [Aromatoleum bremense]